MNITFFHRQHAKSSAIGPHRHRWERKYPPFPYEQTVILLLLVLFVVSTGTWSHFQRVSEQASLYNINKPPLRGDTQSELKALLNRDPVADAVIVGSGLAGMTAALRILDRGGKVVIVEKAASLGGNSNKASSGMNACCIKEEVLRNNDTLELFFDDTVRSAGEVADFELIDTLVQGSSTAIKWIQERTGVDFSLLVQLGGHSRRRTHRPHAGFVGAEIMSAMGRAVREYEKSGQVEIMVQSKAVKILQDRNGVTRGIRIESRDGISQTLRADHIILATGGFAADRRKSSLLSKYRPELLNMASTAGDFSTGDGILLAEDLGATTRDMEKVQLHPTGFVDPNNPNGKTKVLAAELLRGVGGILVNKDGERFCNELGTRAYISDKMLAHNIHYSTRRKWDPEATIPNFFLILSAGAARAAKKHIDTYLHRGLITEQKGINALAHHLSISVLAINRTLLEYQDASQKRKPDVFEKEVFENTFSPDLDTESFFVGQVTPVLHYCMGGLKINKRGDVLDAQGDVIPGLHAAGEVTGGVHGNNRLGGNSLLECVVFGSIIGQDLQLRPTNRRFDGAAQIERIDNKENRAFTMSEISGHNTPSDCFVGLHGNVYDLSSFAESHPGGRASILSLCGSEGTHVFQNIHSERILSSLTDHHVGTMKSQEASTSRRHRRVSTSELQAHNTSDDCWVVIHGKVYNLSKFSQAHAGGAYVIQRLAGQDASDTFDVFHKTEILQTAENLLVGPLQKDGYKKSR